MGNQIITYPEYLTPHLEKLAFFTLQEISFLIGNINYQASKPGPSSQRSTFQNQDSKVFPSRHDFCKGRTYLSRFQDNTRTWKTARSHSLIGIYLPMEVATPRCCIALQDALYPTEDFHY